VAEVDHARVFAWPLQDTLARGGQPLQEGRRMLVAAVLGPQQREDRELEAIRLPAEQVADSVELAVREPEGAMNRLFRYRRQVPESSRLTGRVAAAFALHNVFFSWRLRCDPMTGIRQPHGQSPHGLLVGIASEAS